MPHRVKIADVLESILSTLPRNDPGRIEVIVRFIHQERDDDHETEPAPAKKEGKRAGSS